MLLGLAGVTGTGKSYFKDRIEEELGFEKLKIITTRPPRENEENGVDKMFVTPEELEKLDAQGKIGFRFDMLGITYAYTKEELFSNKNMVFELHYCTIFDFKKVCPHLRTIYIFPNDIETAKDKTRQRNLEPSVEKNRLLEIDEHYKKITTDENLRNQFDHFLYNNYDKESEQKVLDLVYNMIMNDNN